MALCIGQLTNHFTPSKNQVGGELLDHNYNNCMAENKSSLDKSANVFGIGFMSDGATIGRTPFSNMFALTGDVPPCPVAIIDATEHMASGGTKDAAYIAQYMEEHMLKYDPDKTLTDLLLFDGASSVRKAEMCWRPYSPVSLSFMVESMSYNCSLMM